jgi:predicted ATPase
MITSLRLRNFKCFEDQAIEFGPLTLLSGLNGMGKSSVLQALLLLRQSHLQGLLQTRGLALNGELVRLGSAADVLFEGARDDQIAIALTLENGTEANWHFRYDRSADVLELASASVRGGLLESSLFKDSFQSLQAERVGPRTVFEMSDQMVRQHRQLGTRGEFAAHYLASYGNEEIPNASVGHPTAVSRELNHQVEAWLGELCPGAELHVTPYNSLYLVDLRYSFVTGKQRSNEYRSTNVGFGITYSLPVLVALLSAAAGSLVLLENPEAHLHPRGQAALGRLLAMVSNAQVQVVVETHSDHVLNGIRVAVHSGEIAPEAVRLHFFERRERDGQSRTELVSPRIDRDGRISYWPEGFFDQNERLLDALLEPARK